MHDDINTKRTELANNLAAAGAALLDFTGTAAVLAAIPDTEPQQYAAAGTPEDIAKILPATICPQRRQKHGERPTEPLQWEDSAALPADLQQLKALALAVGDDAFDVGIPSEAADEFMAKVSPAVVLDLIARIERATAPHGSAAPTEAARFQKFDLTDYTKPITYSNGTGGLASQRAAAPTDAAPQMVLIGGKRMGRTHVLAQQIIDAMTNEAKTRTGYGNIRDVLDAVARINRKGSEAPHSATEPVAGGICATCSGSGWANAGCVDPCSQCNGAGGAAPVSSDLYETFKAAFLSWNGFHTESELAREWAPGVLAGEMFRAGAASQRAAAPAAYIYQADLERMKGSAELGAACAFSQPVSEGGEAAVPLFLGSQAPHSTAWEQYSDILRIQRREAEADPQDHYMRGLYNGIVMMCSNFDGTTYPMMEAPGIAAAPVSGGERERFEAWALDSSINNWTTADLKRTTGEYDLMPVLCQWEGWQARAAVSASQAAPTGDYVLMPKRLTAENGAKGAMIGEFHEEITVRCPDCDGGDDDLYCASCNDEGTVQQAVSVQWDTIKQIYSRAVELLAAPVASQAAPVGGDDSMLNFYMDNVIATALDSHTRSDDLGEDQMHRNAVSALTAHIAGKIRAAVAAAKVPTVKMLREAADIIVELADSHGAVSEKSIAWMEHSLPLIDAMEAAAPVEKGRGELTEDVIETLMHNHGLIGVAGDDPNWESKLIGFARDAIAAHVGAGVVPEGWKLVPVEPTSFMVGAGARAQLNADTNQQANSMTMAKAAYAAMLAAAPTAATAHPVAADDQVLTADDLLDLEAVLFAVENNDMITAAGIRELYPVDSARIAFDKLASRTTAHGGAQGERDA